MDINKLMIGDWVYNTHHKKNIKITPYDFFTHGHLNGHQYIMGLGTPCLGRDLEPIPLTPEILEKNGFTYSASESNGLCRTYIYGNNSNHVLAEVTLYDLPINGCSCLIRIETDPQTCGGINKIHNCDLLYVHQLQHALRLCGIDKEINL